MAGSFSGKPISFSAPANPESVDEAKQERQHRWIAARERLALVKRLSGNQHDGQRDRRFHWRRTQHEQAECRARQRRGYVQR